MIQRLCEQEIDYELCFTYDSYQIVRNVCYCVVLQAAMY